MAATEELNVLYQTYEKKLEQVIKQASATAGLLGFGEDPRDHSCHDVFYEEVQAWTEEFLESNPAQPEIVAAARWMLEMAYHHRQDPTYWYLYAIHAHAKCLIPHLPNEECARLCAFYDDAYPAVDRMPVQRQVYKMLVQYGGVRKTPGTLLKKIFGK